MRIRRRFRLLREVILTPDSCLLTPLEDFLMTPEVAVQLARETLVTALLLATPILAVATVVSLLINIAQVMTSIQEHTVATVPRIAVVAIATFVCCLGCCAN